MSRDEGAGASAPGLIVDPGMAEALRMGRKTQARVGAASPLAHCQPGDRIRVLEACIAARIEAGREFSTELRRAEFVIFPDGTRRWPDGRAERGKRPGKGDYKWVTALQMPRWATRLTLVLESLRTERLQAITQRDARAEGARPLLGGLLWRWPGAPSGLHLSPRRTFSAHWDMQHPTPGERWADDPQVAVLGFRLDIR